MTNQTEPKRIITATELKQNLGMYLDYVTSNFDVIITKHGQKIARLSPYVTDIDQYFTLQENTVDYALSGRRVTYEEFLEISSKGEMRLEYINGEIFVLSSPSIQHQRISSKLHIVFYEYLQGKPYQVFFAPFDVHLRKKGLKDPDVVQPDLLIVCDLDEAESEDGRYMGTPALVVEILSPSTRRNDMVSKLNSYMLAGVQEYWIVDPDKESVMIYTFSDHNDAGVQIYNTGQQIASSTFTGLTVDVSHIFSR